jgi:predicted transcriptional regulator
MSNYRAEALAKLVDNGVSAANMEIWIAGYIAGREETNRELLLKYEAVEFIPKEL